MLKLKPRVLLLLCALPFAAIGCGKKNEPAVTNTTSTATANCQGQVWTQQYGCIQASSQMGYGIYNGQQVPASCQGGLVMTQGSGCQPNNGQYPNQQYPNQQYPNQQYPNQQYPQQQQSYGYYYWNGYGYVWRAY